MKKNLNILLVEPSNEVAILGGGATAPLWPCVLSALTPKQHNLNFIHCTFEEINESKLTGYDLVGISSRTETAMHAYHIGDMCKIMKIPCVMGGIHPFFLPDETKQHCDSIVLGEAEYIWQTVLEDLQKGELKEIYKGEHTKPEDIPIPDKSIVKKYKYKIENVLESVRGCPFNCDFCCATLYSGKKFRYKPVNNIIKEIESWKRRSSFSVIADLNMTSSFDKAKELFTAMSSYNLNWWGYASINVAEDDELLKLMSKAGCLYLGIGFESVSKETLKEMNKKKNLNTDYKEIVRKLHYYNIDIFGNFIFGMDTDTTDVFKDTVEFVIDAEIDFPVFQILVPYPGTKVYKTLEADDRLLTKDWSKYTRCDVVYQPKNMTKDQLMEGFFWAYKKAYSKRNRTKKFFSRWKGARKYLYDRILTSHFAKQHRLLKRYHTGS